MPNQTEIQSSTSPTNTDPLKQSTLRYLRRMLDYRRQYDQRRAGFYRQYVGQRDAQKFPDNLTARANTFVPYPLSNVETIVSRVLDAFFSFSPWFEASGSTPSDDNASDSMALILYKKLKEAHAIEKIETLVRNILIYGHSGIKVDWNWDYKTLTKPVPNYAMDSETQQPIVNPDTGQPVVLGFVPQTFRVPMACPRITPIDVYDLMCDPDGGIIAHLTEKTFVEMKRENEAYSQAKNEYLYDPAVMDRIEKQIKAACPEDYPSVLVRYAELWNEYEGTCTIMTYGDDKEAVAWKDLRASFRSANLSSYKRKVYEGNEILWHGPNQFAHQRNPILHTSYIKLPNELYGLGTIEISSELSESLNKFVNMITDNWNLGINRRFAYDVNADIDHEALNLMNVPGGKIPVNGSPRDVIEPLPLFTPNQGDYAIIDLYKGMIEASTGVSDFYSKGVGSSGGNRTATGVSSVINESNFRFKMFIRNLEVDVLQPLLEMCASMVQQFMSDAEEVQITKNPTPNIPKWQVIQPEDLIGNFDFNLVAANYATNKTVRQRNLMAFMQLAQQSPYWKAGAGIREFGKVMEIHDINNLLYTDQEVQMMQEQAEQKQQQQMLMQEVVQTESKIEIAKAHAALGLGKGAGTGGGSSHKTPPRPNPSSHAVKDRGGRPAHMQFEGKIPGANETGAARSEGQQMGANAVGLEGMGV